MQIILAFMIGLILVEVSISKKPARPERVPVRVRSNDPLRRK